MNIKDPEVHAMARKLAELKGCSITEAVKIAVEQALLEVTNQQSPSPPLTERLNEIALHCASLPDYDSRSADQILGYDDNGLPS